MHKKNNNNICSLLQLIVNCHQGNSKILIFFTQVIGTASKESGALISRLLQVLSKEAFKELQYKYDKIVMTSDYAWCLYQVLCDPY